MVSYFNFHQVKPMIHGIPIPRKTLAVFVLGMFPIDESANFELFAAEIEAKVSDKDEPKATRRRPFRDSFKCAVHSSTVTTSLIMAVTRPISPRATMKANQPPNHRRGGTKAATTFQ